MVDGDRWAVIRNRQPHSALWEGERGSPIFLSVGVGFRDKSGPNERTRTAVPGSDRSALLRLRRRRRLARLALLFERLWVGGVAAVGHRRRFPVPRAARRIRPAAARRCISRCWRDRGWRVAGAAGARAGAHRRAGRARGRPAAGAGDRPAPSAACGAQRPPGAAWVGGAVEGARGARGGADRAGCGSAFRGPGLAGARPARAARPAVGIALHGLLGGCRRRRRRRGWRGPCSQISRRRSRRRRRSCRRGSPRPAYTGLAPVFLKPDGGAVSVPARLPPDGQPDRRHRRARARCSMATAASSGNWTRGATRRTRT